MENGKIPKQNVLYYCCYQFLLIYIYSMFGCVVYVPFVDKRIVMYKSDMIKISK